MTFSDLSQIKQKLVYLTLLGDVLGPVKLSIINFW